MLDLYKNIRDRRKALKMSQEELALKVGYTNRSTIATIEKGNVDIPISKIKELASALDCTAADLMGWTSDDGMSFDQGVRGADLLNKYNALTPEHQEMIDRQIDLFLEMEK